MRESNFSAQYFFAVVYHIAGRSVELVWWWPPIEATKCHIHPIMCSVHLDWLSCTGDILGAFRKTILRSCFRSSPVCELPLCLCRSKYKCVSASETRRKGAGDSAPRLAAGKRPTSLFPTSCLRPLPVMLLAVVRAAVSAPRAAGSMGGNMRGLGSACVLPCGLGEGGFACLENRGDRTRCEAAGRSASHVSYRRFVHRISGRRRSFDWVMKGALFEALFPAAFPRRSRPAAAIVCGIVGVARSGAGAMLEDWLVTLVISPSVIVFVWQDVFKKSANPNEWPGAFPSSPPSLIHFKRLVGSPRQQAHGDVLKRKTIRWFQVFNSVLIYSLALFRR